MEYSARLNLRKNNLVFAFLIHPCEIERNKLKFFRVKKFILFEARRIWSGRVINFSEKVENLSFYEPDGLFLFCHFSFGKRKMARSL